MYSSEYINQHSAYVLISIVQVIKHKGSFKKDVTEGGGYVDITTVFFQHLHFLLFSSHALRILFY